MYISVKKEGETLVVKDNRNRILMRNNGDKVAVARFPDLDETLKDYLAQLYVDLTGNEISKVEQFLNYENEENEENEFCS